VPSSLGKPGVRHPRDARKAQKRSVVGCAKKTRHARSGQAEKGSSTRTGTEGRVSRGPSPVQARDDDGARVAEKQAKR
jgi:hypothetical protein